MAYTILPPEHIGNATADSEGILDVGGVPVRLGSWGMHGHIPVYIRRSSSDLSIVEILIARHDGLAQMALDAQNEEARHYSLGPKEYWRGEVVGKWTTGPERRLMTEEDFENMWEEQEGEV